MAAAGQEVAVSAGAPAEVAREAEAAGADAREVEDDQAAGNPGDVRAAGTITRATLASRGSLVGRFLEVAMTRRAFS